MNILLSTNTNLDRGGISVFMLQWLRGIKSLNNDNKIYLYFRGTIIEPEMQNAFRSLGAIIYTGDIPDSIGYKNAKANRKLRRDIRELLQTVSFDVIHINSRFLAFNVILLSEAKRKRIPIRISHFHGSLAESLFNKPVHYFLRYRICSLATIYAGCSKMSASYLFGKAGVNSPKWRFIPNTIQTKKFMFDKKKREDRRKEIGVMSEEILLGTVGRVVREKNQGFLLDLVNDIGKAGVHVKLLILGEGAEKSALTDRCKELGIEDRVIFYGQALDVPGWLSAMDYFLMPSLSEGFPISVVEAQANGLMCFLSDQITSEVALSNNVVFLPINEGSKVWVTALANTPPVEMNNRIKGIDIVKYAGFDENDTPRYVAELYSLQ